MSDCPDAPSHLRGIFDNRLRAATPQSETCERGALTLGSPNSASTKGDAILLIALPFQRAQSPNHCLDFELLLAFLLRCHGSDRERQPTSSSATSLPRDFATDSADLSSVSAVIVARTMLCGLFEPMHFVSTS